MSKEVFSVSLLILGFAFTFFVSGSSLVELLFPKLPVRIKFPLYFILSLLISTYTVYIVSLLVGFSRYSILVSFFLFIPIFVYVLISIRATIKSYIKAHLTALIGGLFVLSLFFAALYPAIFTWHDDYIVMASSNWQDTAMHMGIIESISQGNFPPQAPYYAGVPLSYYYFADFHSAILVTLYGKFFPRVLVYDNPIFAFMFFLAIYTLSYELTKKRLTSFLSALTGSLFSSYMFVRFISDLLGSDNTLSLASNVIRLLVDHSYSMEYEQLFQMANLADYFLQNRPMMIGLPVGVMVITLLLYALKKRDVKLVLFSGLITGLAIKFQFFAVVSLAISFLVILSFYGRKLGVRLSLKYLLVYFLPTLGLYLISSSQKINSQSLIDLLKDNFSFGPWERNQSLLWHLRFIVSNFGAPLIIAAIAQIWMLVMRLTKKKVPRGLILVSVLSWIFFLIPYSLRFTVFKGDMFKFFYFTVVFSVVTTFWFLETVIRNKRLLMIVTISIVVSSTCSSFLTLINSILNKNFAYSKAEYKAGLWIRDNTPQKSVFVTNPTVHCAVTQIGGRLRVLSYINWPYSHGYNSGKDNVFARLEDVKKVYAAEDIEAVKEVLAKYNAEYIYLSRDEREAYPEAEKVFSRADYLKEVYFQDGIIIYEVI